MTPVLSILTPGVPTRFRQAANLLIELHNQTEKLENKKEVELLFLCDNWQATIGEKRQALVRLARGQYIAFVDDDDLVSPDYVSEVLAGCKTGAHVITFLQDVTWNDHRGIIRFQYGSPWADMVAGATTNRPPNHTCAWRRDIAAQCLFPSLNWGEDAPWSELANQIAATSFHNDKVLHIYNHQDETSESLLRDAGIAGR